MLQYSLVYEQKVYIRRPRMPFLTGCVVHDSIKAWADKGYPQGYIQDVAAALFRSQTAGIRFSNRGAYLKILRRVIAGATMAEHLYRILKFPEHGAYIEEWFNLPFPDSNGDYLVGGADVYDPTSLTVYDLKLHMESDVSDREQLLTYALSELIRERKVENIGFISPLKANKLKAEPISKAEIGAHREILMKSLIHMKVGVMPEPTPGKWCYLCGYRGTKWCPATYRELKL